MCTWLGLWFGMVNNVCHRSVGSHTRKGICKPCEGGRARHSSTSAVRSGPARRRTIHHGVAHEVLVPLDLRYEGPAGEQTVAGEGGDDEGMRALPLSSNRHGPLQDIRRTQREARAGYCSICLFSLGHASWRLSAGLGGITSNQTSPNCFLKCYGCGQVDSGGEG